MSLDKVDMSLDDIIKMSNSNKRGRGRGYQRGQTRGQVADRTTSQVNNNRRNSFKRNQQKFLNRSFEGNSRNFASVNVEKQFMRRVNSEANVNFSQKPAFVRNGNFSGNGFVNPTNRTSNNVNGVWTIVVSNLHPGVTDQDMVELFSEFGRLKSASVNYNMFGVSQGSAKVVFLSKYSALKAIKQYNNVPLDGKPMCIELVTKSPLTNSIQQPRIFRGAMHANSRHGGTYGGGRLNQETSRHGQMRGRMTRGRGGKRVQASVQPISKEQLDMELDSYRNQLSLNHSSN